MSVVVGVKVGGVCSYWRLGGDGGGRSVEVVGVALRSPDIVFAGALAPFL